MPITALAFYRHGASQSEYILAGEDGDLVIYTSGSAAAPPSALRRVRVFTAQPIHGISVGYVGGAATVLLWGGSSVAVVGGEHVDSLLDDAKYVMRGKVARLQAPDWIYDGAVSPLDASSAVLVTAHNETVRLHYDAASCIAQLSKEVVSPSRPMLYVANVQWASSGTEILVAAGTVFGDILVWKHAADEAVKQQPQMLFSLSGHEGSIFGVCISPVITLQNGQTVRLLASCSDDRTIRVWDITERMQAGGEGGQALPQAKAHLPVPDTGFRCAPVYEGNETPDQGREDVAAIAVTMGHASRIWGVKFGVQGTQEQGAKLPDNGLINVYSFGEDTTVQKWTLNLPAALEQPTKLTHARTWSLHDGKHLWSRAVLSGLHTTEIITGGADGKVTYLQDCESKNSKSGVITLDIDDLVAPETPAHQQLRGGKRSSREMVSRYDFLTHNTLIAGTNLGRMFTGVFDGSQAVWTEIHTHEAVREDMKNIYVVRTIAHGVALLGSTTGKIYMYHLSRGLEELTTVPGRVVEMNALSSTAEGYDGVMEAIVHLHGTASSWLLTVDGAKGELVSEEEIHGLDGRFVAISAARIGDLLAIGSRHGWLTLLQRDAEKKYQPVLELPPHSRDAVTSIISLPASENGALDSPAYLLVTSRDGKYRIYQMHHDSQGNPTLELIHETAPPFGPWIEGAWFTKGQDGTPELILYGFRSKHFVIWNETRREELATMDCGGAHRTFRLVYSADDASRCRFAFTRTSKLSVYTQDGIAHRPVKLGTHGREIRTVSTNGRYVATGAEDASIRLWEYQPAERGGQQSSEMRYMACIKMHVSGLQRVQWLGEDYLFSSAGNEEMYAWRMRKLDSAYAAIAVVCEGVFTDKSAVGDLRIMDFDVSRRGGDDDSSILATLAFSNSTLKSYEYREGQFTLVCEGVYTGACLTQARHLDGGAEGELRVLTAATDGHISLWKSKQADSGGAVHKYELVEATKVHQNSIKSLDVTRLAGPEPGCKCGSMYGVTTGGDDGGLGYTAVTSSEASMAARPVAMVRRAHAAAVTGVTVVPVPGRGRLHDDGGEPVRVATVSNDQWVKVWQMPGWRGAEGVEHGEKQGPATMALVGEAYSGVADAGDVATVGGGGWEEEEEEEEDEGNFRGPRSSRPVRVVAAGVGIEVWSVDLCL